MEGYISLALMRWALPFLGLVSGYLFFLSPKPTAAGILSKLRSRIRTLLVPFLISSGLGVLFAVAVIHSPYRDISAYWTMDSVGEALDRWLLHPVIYPLWFLQALWPWISATAFPPFIVGATIAILGWRAPWAADAAAAPRPATGPLS